MTVNFRCFLNSSYGSGVLFQALNKQFVSLSPWFLPVVSCSCCMSSSKLSRAGQWEETCWMNGLILEFLWDFWATGNLLQLSLQPLSTLASSEVQRGFNCTLISDFMAGAVATGGRQDPHINWEYGHDSQRFPPAFMVEPEKKHKRNLKSVFFWPKLEHLKDYK